jgi:hypothetical protein
VRGGEAAFLAAMIEQSKEFASQCLWFSSLVSKKENLPAARKALARVGAREVRVLDMAQGNKVSRILAWSFLDDEQRKAGGLPREMIEDGAQWRHGPRLFFSSDVDSFAALHSIVFLPVFARMLVTTSRLVQVYAEIFLYLLMKLS